MLNKAIEANVPAGPWTRSWCHTLFERAASKQTDIIQRESAEDAEVYRESQLGGQSDCETARQRQVNREEDDQCANSFNTYDFDFLGGQRERRGSIPSSGNIGGTSDSHILDQGERHHTFIGEAPQFQQVPYYQQPQYYQQPLQPIMEFEIDKLHLANPENERRNNYDNEKHC